MQRASQSLILLATSVVVMLVALCAPVFLYVRIADGRSYVSRVEGDIVQASQREERERELKQHAQTIAPQRAALEDLSIGKDAAADFISGIEATAKEANVSLDLTGVEVGGDTVGRLRTLSMQAHAEGSLDGVMKFLRLCETLPTATAVRGVSLERRDKSWALTATLQTPIKQTP